jgi:poly(3-hydroxyalkanoate) synthetase
MKDLENNYLAELVVAIDDLGGRVNLVGLCQGGWMSAMIAAPCQKMTSCGVGQVGAARQTSRKKQVTNGSSESK